MSGRTSKAHDLARVAYEKSGGTMLAKELAKKYGLALTTIYRAPWWKKTNKNQTKGE